MSWSRTSLTCRFNVACINFVSRSLYLATPPFRHPLVESSWRLTIICLAPPLGVVQIRSNKSLYLCLPLHLDPRVWSL